MTGFTKYLAAAAAVGSLAAPAAAQYYPQQPAYPQAYSYPQYQQQYPQVQQPYAQPAYPGTTYGYGQQAYNQNPIQQVIDSLLGNRYTVTDRQAVSQCASAAITQAAAQYGNRGYGQQYGQDYGRQYGQQYGQGYNRASEMRVTSITGVQRRRDGLRVTGLMSSTSYRDRYADRGYAAQGNVSFRCTVDNRGAVSGLRLRSNTMGYRG